jgi:hypothetical protein
MTGRCAWVIAAMACFTLNGAIGQAPFDIQLQAFSASRRPPASPLGPVPVADAPPPKPAEPEKPPFTLVGTAIGKPQNVALIIEQTTKNLVRLRVGEAASGWYLRSVD